MNITDDQVDHVDQVADSSPDARESGSTATRRRGSVTALVAEARPKQWLKNVLVFAAPGAAGVLNDWHRIASALITFVAFCAVSSGTYFWNDLIDVESDRKHPQKRYRPIAAGEISPRLAMVVGTALLGGGVVAGMSTSHWQTTACLGAYVLLTLSYSTWLKHIAVVDLVAVAGGFVLRAAGGAVGAQLRMSTWFVLVMIFGSLFIVTGKRYAELVQLGKASSTRATLQLYSVEYLRMLLGIFAGATLLAYCQWALNTSEMAETRLPYYQMSIIPILMALLRYLLLLEHGSGGAPEEVFFRDRPLQLFGACWLVLCAVAIYIG